MTPWMKLGGPAISPSCVAAVSTAWNTASMLSAASVSKRARAALVKVMKLTFERPPLFLEAPVRETARPP